MDPDPDSDPSIFIIDLQDANKKRIKKKFFCIVLFEGTFTSFFKDKKSKRSHKTVEIKVFLTINDGRIRIHEAQNHVDSVDPDPDSNPDPEHWKQHLVCCRAT
jgi:hypothetical protein